MFRLEKPAQEIFPIEAFRSLAEWFLDQLIDRVSVINAGELNEKSWGIGKQISQEKKQTFVNKVSQDLFEQMKGIKLIPGQTRNLPISIPQMAYYAKEAGFPELCIPKDNLIKPMAWLIPEGKITFDDGFNLGDIYAPKKTVRYQTSYLEKSTIEEPRNKIWKK